MYFASYPADAAGMVRAFNEVGSPESVKLAGGALVGMQSATLMESMGPMLNGILNYDYFVPASTLQFEGTEAFLAKYSPRAPRSDERRVGTECVRTLSSRRSPSPYKKTIQTHP